MTFVWPPGRWPSGPSRQRSAGSGVCEQNRPVRGSVAFALFPRGELAADANVTATGNGFAMAHHVASELAVQALLDEAVATGATLVPPPGNVFCGGFRGYFADPDGFLWEVCYNPFIPLDAGGFIRLP